jgi:hypothetical protein
MPSLKSGDNWRHRPIQEAPQPIAPESCERRAARVTITREAGFARVQHDRADAEVAQRYGEQRRGHELAACDRPVRRRATRRRRDALDADRLSDLLDETEQVIGHPAASAGHGEDGPLGSPRHHAPGGGGDPLGSRERVAAELHYHRPTHRAAPAVAFRGSLAAAGVSPRA